MTYDSLTEDQRYLLLELIQERPILYDRNNERYKNVTEKEIAWQEVSERCNAQGNYFVIVFISQLLGWVALSGLTNDMP